MSKNHIFLFVAMILFLMVFFVFLRRYLMNMEGMTNADITKTYNWLSSSLPSKQDRLADTYTYSAAYTFWDGQSWQQAYDYKSYFKCGFWGTDTCELIHYKQVHSDTYVPAKYTTVQNYKEHDYTANEIATAQTQYEKGIKDKYAKDPSYNAVDGIALDISNNLNSAAINFNTIKNYMKTFVDIGADNMTVSLKTYQTSLQTYYDVINANYIALYATNDPSSNLPLNRDIVQVVQNLNTAYTALQNKQVPSSNGDITKSYNDTNAMAATIDRLNIQFYSKVSTIQKYCNNITNAVNTATPIYNSMLTSMEAYSAGLIANKASDNYTIISAIAAIAPAQTDIMTAAKLQRSSVTASKYLQQVNQSAVDASNNYSLQLAATKANNITGSQTYQAAVHDAYLLTVKYGDLVQGIYNDASGVVTSIMQKAYDKDHQGEKDATSIREAQIIAEGAVRDAGVSYSLAKTENDHAHTCLAQGKEDVIDATNKAAQFPNSSSNGAAAAKNASDSYNKVVLYSSQSDTAFRNVIQQYDLTTSYLAKIQSVNVTAGMASSCANFALQSARDASQNWLETSQATRNTIEEFNRTHSYRLMADIIFDGISDETAIFKDISDMSSTATTKIAAIADTITQINTNIVNCNTIQTALLSIQDGAKNENVKATADIGTATTINTGIQSILTPQVQSEGLQQSTLNNIKSVQKNANSLLNDMNANDMATIKTNLNTIVTIMTTNVPEFFNKIPNSVSSDNNASTQIGKTINGYVTDAKNAIAALKTATDKDILSKVDAIRKISSNISNQVSELDAITDTNNVIKHNVQDGLDTLTKIDNDFKSILDTIKGSHDTISAKIKTLTSYKDAIDKLLFDDRNTRFTALVANISDVSTATATSIADLSNKSSELISTINNYYNMYNTMIDYQSDSTTKQDNSNANTSIAHVLNKIIQDISIQFTNDTTSFTQNKIKEYQTRSVKLYSYIQNTDMNNIITNLSKVGDTIKDIGDKYINTLPKNTPNDEYNNSMGVKQQMDVLVETVVAKGKTVSPDTILSTIADVKTLLQKATSLAATQSDLLSSIVRKTTIVNGYNTNMNTGLANVTTYHDVINASTTSILDKTNTISSYRDAVEQLLSQDKSIRTRQDAQSVIDTKAAEDAENLVNQQRHDAYVNQQNAILLQQQKDASANELRNKMDIVVANRVVPPQNNANYVSSNFGTKNQDIDENYFLDWGKYSVYY